MKKAFLFAAAILACAAANAQSTGNPAAPLGLELGKTKCARMTPGNHEKTGRTPWAGGDALELKNVARFNLAGLTRATVNCDAQDAVALVTLTFERSALDAVTRTLDGRYESKRKTDTGAENGYAEWAATNGSIELLYGRDSKHFTVAYWGKGAKARYFSYSGAQDKAAAATVPATPPAKQPAPL